jgi:hypothetical protein
LLVHRPVRILFFIATLLLAACSQAVPSVPIESTAGEEIQTASPSVEPSTQPVFTPAIATPDPRDIRLRVVSSMTAVRRKCWDQGQRFRPKCGVIYSVTVRVNAKTTGTVIFTWDARLSTHDSCCGDRTLNTYFQRMNTPKIVAGKAELTRVSEWDGYYMQRSPTIKNYNIPTGLTDGTFAHMTLKKGAMTTITFSIVFDNGGGGYMSYPYPLRFRVLGDGKLLTSFTQDSKD